MTIDVAVARAACAEPVGDAPLAPEWLRESWRDPLAFQRALVADHVIAGAPPKSRPQEGIDFGHDLVLRHAPERTAFLTLLPHRRRAGLSYGELELRSRRVSEDWRARGLAAGHSVCLLLPLGEDLVIAMVAALRSGLSLTLLPPGGPRWIARRLAAAEASAIVTLRTYAPLVPAGAIFLGDEPRASAAPRRASITWAPQAIAARLFCERDAREVPLPISAEELFLGALRDGRLALSLRANDTLAAPGMHFLSHQPALLLAALACGATFVHAELDSLAADPALLDDQPLRAIGVSAPLRDLLLRHPGAPLPWSAWFRDPEERLDWDAWRRFIAARGLGDVPAANLLVDAASGGAILWSWRRRGKVTPACVPAPGRAWTLTALGTTDGEGRGPEAGGDVGLFTQGKKKPYVIVVRAGDELHYAGTWDARVDGHVYRAAEVEAAAATLPFVAGAAVVMDRAGTLGQALRVLVVFTGDRVAEPANKRALETALAHALGHALMPDRILYVPLYPRRDEAGQIDRAWCERQYAAGLLFHKPRRPLYQLLTRLRGRLVRS